MTRPTLNIESLDWNGNGEALSADNPASGVLSETSGAALNMGSVATLGTTSRFAFRITVVDWNTGGGTPDSGKFFRNVRIWVDNQELRADTFLIGFTNTWSERNSVALVAAPGSPPAEPNTPASWSLSPSRLTSGYCILQFRKSAYEYPNKSFGGDGVGTVRVRIQGEHA